MQSSPNLDNGNLPLGVLAGAVAAIIGALIWGGIGAATHYQIGYIAVGIGFAVAYAIRFVGRGHDSRFGIASAILAVAGCALGKYFTGVISVAQSESRSYIEVFETGLPRFFSILQHHFHIMDLAFYGFAAYFGYKYATTPLRPQAQAQSEPEPTQSA